MAHGCPDHPPPDLEFIESPDDESCPSCGWDSEPARLDYNAAFNKGVLLAVEVADGSPYGAMGGAMVSAIYYRCPTCSSLFSTEEETFLGAMS